LFGGHGSGETELVLPAGSQRVLADVVSFLRDAGVGIPSAPPQGGALFVSFEGVPTDSDVYAGVRTSTRNPDAEQGGTFGVFSPAVPPAALATSSARVVGLRQDASVRSNLAVVNAGESPVTLSVSLRSPRDGSQLIEPLERTLAPGEWYQWSGILAAGGEPEAWAIVTRVSGDAPWLAYGVLNDARTSDGTYVVHSR
ncbi:MAG: hypothetical protein JNK60_14655, partial [Acidobacteria bacterium]|nr:hypothetical protein [Acidobacteriota bacterium]